MRPTACAGDAVKTFEHLGQLVGGYAGAGVTDGELEVRAGVAQLDLDCPVEGELEGVRHEVENDLFPHVPIDICRLGDRRTIDVKPQPRPLDSRAKNTGELRREGRKVDRFVRGVGAAGFNARKIKQCIDELEKAQTVTLDEIDLSIGRA
jgi:hypothetical protein